MCEVAKLDLRDFGSPNLERFETAGVWCLVTVLTTTEVVNMQLALARGHWEVAVGETENRVRKSVESLEGINKLTGIGNVMISLLACEFKSYLSVFALTKRGGPRWAVTTSSG